MHISFRPEHDAVNSKQPVLNIKATRTLTIYLQHTNSAFSCVLCASEPQTPSSFFVVLKTVQTLSRGF